MLLISLSVHQEEQCEQAFEEAGVAEFTGRRWHSNAFLPMILPESQADTCIVLLLTLSVSARSYRETGGQARYQSKTQRQKSPIPSEHQKYGWAAFGSGLQPFLIDRGKSTDGRSEGTGDNFRKCVRTGGTAPDRFKEFVTLEGHTGLSGVTNPMSCSLRIKRGTFDSTWLPQKRVPGFLRKITSGNNPPGDEPGNPRTE